jgi:uncharacterized protein YbcI
MHCISTLTIILRRRCGKAIGRPFLSKVGDTKLTYSSQMKTLCMTYERRAKNRLGHCMVLPQGGIEKRTVGEMEAAVCQGVSRFEQDYMGRGPKDIHAHLLGDLLVVRLQGVLTAAEQHLAKSPSGEEGRDLLKQMRTHLIETARPALEAMVREVTGVKVLSMHHDISTVTGEKVVLFTLAESPLLCDAKKK